MRCASAVVILTILLVMSGCGVHFNALPTVSFTPNTVSWHKVDVGDTSGPMTVTLTNTSAAGAQPLTISSINITANFMVTGTTCKLGTGTLLAGATCTITVAFRPQTSGALTGTLSLNSNATNNASVALSATGGVGFLLFNPTSLSFPGVPANSVSQPQTATLTNEATTPVTIAGFTTSGHFAEGNNCPISPDTLAPGGSCTVTVTSDPVASGAITGAVNVKDDVGNVTQLYLSGTDQGMQYVGVLDFTPSSLLWGDVTVGSTSAVKTITVMNTQSTSVTFSDISTGPDFTVTGTTCPLAPASLGGGASCMVSVAFRPTEAGSITELLTFTDNAAGSPQALALKGTGTMGDMLFAPTSLLFAGVDPGQVSPAQTATLTNETAGSISLASVTVSGHFAQTNNCPATLGPQASCTFDVTANPVANGVITGSVNVKDSLGNSVQLYLQGQGGGTNNVLSFSPNPVVWGTIDVGQTSGAKTLTVDNGQTVPLTIYSISIGQDFIETASTCPTAPSVVAAGASCTISLAFRPYSAGAKSEVITFTDDAPGGNQSVSLRGTGAIGSLLFDPAALSFAGVAPNTVSPSQTATLTNESAAAVTLASITLSGHFAQTNNCPGSLAPQASCTFTVTSNPVIDGPIQGSVNVKDGTGATTQLYLSGLGGVLVDPGGPGNNQVALSPSSVAFGDVAVGQTSGASAITLSNGTADDVTISSITAGPDIYETANTCPVAPYTLAGGASCAVSVAFRPQSTGAKSETLTFTDDASSSPQWSTITGTGTPGSLLFTPTSLDFPSAVVGSTGTAQASTLTNELTSPLTLKSIQAMGPFVQTNDCPTSPNTLAAGASCTVSVSADAEMAGPLTGSVDATDSTGAVTQLYLSGTATGSSGTTLVTVSPTTLSWGNVAVGSSSGVKTVTFTNNQSAAMTISSITTGADFAVSANTCPAAPTQLAAGANCLVSVIFRPTSVGAKSEPLAFADNATGSPQTAILTGTGTTGSLSFSPGSLTFAATGVGDASTPQTATLTNASAAAITLSGITLSGAFTESNNCPTGSFAPSATCTVSVTSKPTAIGAYTGSVNVHVTGGSGTQLYLIGTGANPGTGAATLTPASKTFTSVYAGGRGTPVAFTLKNNGSVAVAISQIGISTANFSEANNCGTSLAGNGSCTISVTFNPQSSGPQTATLTVMDNASNNPQTAMLSGTGLVAPLTLSPTSLSWGNIAVGTSSGAKMITLANTQTSVVIMDSITAGPDFVISANTCPASGGTLAAGGSCNVSVIFRPSSAGAKSESLTFTDNAANSPQIATLSGTGTTGSLLFSPGSLAFGSVMIGNSSTPQMSTLTNESGAAVTLSSITVTGAFTQTNNCPIGAFAANASCTVTVMSKPTAVGSFSGSVNVKVSTGSGTLLYLTGTGTKPPTGTATLSPASYHFTGVTSGQSGTPFAFTLTNNGATPITISQIAISNANFTQTNTCDGSLAGNSSCVISVIFSPQSVGQQSATLTVSSDASNSPQTAMLSGTGLAAGSSSGALKVVPSTYTFPNQTTGTTSSAEVLTVTNTLSTGVTISSVQIPAPFSETNTCGALAGGASCTVSLKYSPTAVGYTSADLTFTYNATGSPQTVFIGGNSEVAVTIMPSSLGFSPQIPNRPSSPQTITITNNQTTALTIDSITSTASPIPSPFTLTNTCIPAGQTTGTVAANSNCTIDVTFDPTKTDQYTGSVTIAYNALGSPQTVTYTGSGITGGSNVAVAVTPQSSCVEPSQTEQFTADVTNTANTAVTWYVNNTLNGTGAVGTISAGGLYTAPGGTGTYTIKAVSQANTTANGTTTVSVTSSPGFAIYPFSASIPTGGTQTFQGQICGVPDTNNVTYTVDGVAGGNATVGTITTGGVYTAPNTAGKHVIKATDTTLGKSSNASVTVYSGITVDFGSRTNQQYPVAPGMLGANHVDDLHNLSDINLLGDSGLDLSRTYALIPQVYATQTPDWTQIDPRISLLQQAGMHVLMQIAFTPPWLQPNPNPCGAGSTAAMPTDVNQWAQIAASYVAHMDAEFPGVVTDYEIGNEPDAGGLCGVPSKPDAYMSLYAAAAPLMKQQAQSDGKTIRIGGPSVTSPSAEWITDLLTNSSTAPYVDFVSYHNYMEGTAQASATWDTYNGITPLYQATQSPSGAAAAFTKVSALVAAGQQPLGAKTPIYIDEYNTDWAAVQDCCRNNPTYGPLWNALYVSDLMNTVYSGASGVPGKLAYFSANAYPYFCLLGTWDSAMDCQYSQGSTPVPYPQYYAYQLMASTNYLGLNSGGYMAPSVSPAVSAGGIVTTAFYTPTQDSMLIVNPTGSSYSGITVTVQNAGFSSPQAVLYQIVNGNQITSSSLQLTAANGGYTATISVPAYTVMAIAIQGQ